MKSGTAEVVYLNKEDVQKAIQKYNNRELDGKNLSASIYGSGAGQVNGGLEKDCLHLVVDVRWTGLEKDCFHLELCKTLEGG